MPTPIAPAAQSGFSNASSYDQHRPSYPPLAVSQLLSHLNVAGKKGAKIIDLAAGTGKFTESLAAREEGYEIFAVEPHDDMRGQLEGKKLANVVTVRGHAGDIPVEGGSVDGVVVAQAFHWFANEDSLREIHRVLRPGGVLGMIWNVDDCASNALSSNIAYNPAEKLNVDKQTDNAPRSWTATTEWETKVKAITLSLDDNQPRFRHDKWKAVLDNNDLKLFAWPMGEGRVPFKRTLSKQAIWDRYCTLSHVANLQGEELKSIKKQVFDALENDKEATNSTGELALNGVTYFVWMEAI
ncbi:hypothetical protein FQN50_001344 [Emmonsiellopsis sp. PD_5]|nr:hypothetical protein FQN50_001344 [Emmonsiellopsis sp. PD_5]